MNTRRRKPLNRCILCDIRIPYEPAQHISKLGHVEYCPDCLAGIYDRKIAARKARQKAYDTRLGTPSSSYVREAHRIRWANVKTTTSD